METVDITLPVSRAAAERLRVPEERARLGALISLAAAGLLSAAGLAEALAAATREAGPEEHQRAALDALAEIQRAASAAGITPDEVEANLAAWKRERASNRAPTATGAGAPGTAATGR